MGSPGSRCAGSQDVDVFDGNRGVRTIVALVGCHASDLLNQFDCLVIALAEESVFAIEMRRRNFSDEKLRAVGIWPGVCHCQSSRAIKEQRGVSLIVELVAGISFSRAFRIAALNHK